ncbi:MAG: nitroreductase family protein [Acidimicrobiia bacterium]|nr:nitroreductase family protein [Acidimicrobiia bacterium]
MDFYDTIANRRMVRNYTDDPVDRVAVERIVDAARRAPSAGFSQGHSFVVVTDESVRHAIAGLAGETKYVANGYDPWISRAPVHVVVCVREASYHERYNEPDKTNPDGTEVDWPIPWWWVDVGGALVTLLLGAVAEGLAAGVLGTHATGDLRTLLGIPDDVVPVGVVTIGHPAPDRRSGSLARGWKPKGEVIHWEKWSS